MRPAIIIAPFAAAAVVALMLADPSLAALALSLIAACVAR